MVVPLWSELRHASIPIDKFVTQCTQRSLITCDEGMEFTKQTEGMSYVEQLDHILFLLYRRAVAVDAPGDLTFCRTFYESLLKSGADASWYALRGLKENMKLESDGQLKGKQNLLVNALDKMCAIVRIRSQERTRTFCVSNF